MGSTQTVAGRVIRWLRWGYPGGVGRRRLTILDVLGTRLTDDEVESIACDLAEQVNRTAEVSEDDIRVMIVDRVFAPVDDGSVARVLARLGEAGRLPAPSAAERRV